MSVNSPQSIADNHEKYAKYFTKKDKDAFSTENFFTLLMAEMSHQDPLEPMSNTEFISQLATFSSLKAQQDALYYQNANYAQSLVGKSVTVAMVNGSSLFTDSGIVTSMSLVEGEFMIKVNGKNYPLSNIMEVLPTQNPFAVPGSDGAYATSLIDRTVTVMVTDATGKKVTETGTVSHIEIKNNEINVIIDKVAYPLASVVKVEPESAVTSLTDSNRAYATSLIGKFVVVSEDPSDPNSPVLEHGIVTSVEIIGSRISVIIGGFGYPLAGVTWVEDVSLRDGENQKADGTGEPGEPGNTTDPGEPGNTTDPGGD